MSHVHCFSNADGRQTCLMYIAFQMRMAAEHVSCTLLSKCRWPPNMSDVHCSSNADGRRTWAAYGEKLVLTSSETIDRSGRYCLAGDSGYQCRATKSSSATAHEGVATFLEQATSEQYEAS
jgi:hypothetical protein